MNVRVTVFDGEQYDGDWPTPGYAASFMDGLAWFQAKLALIPKEFRATAVLDIDSTSGHEGEHYPRLVIWYDRPETPKEAAARSCAENEQRIQKRDKELATLRALQAKYPAA